MNKLTEWLLKTFPSNNSQKRWFVEAGAHNGVLYPTGGSSTWELEQAGWDGLCIEPSTYYIYLAENRKCKTDSRALGPKDGETLVFSQMLGDHVELSGLSEYFQQDRHDRQSLPSIDHQVKTVTLNTILFEHGAPRVIEFLCLDTEGSELAILSNHSFRGHRFSTIFVEYNGVEQRREALTNLLLGKQYNLKEDDGQNLLFVGREVECSLT